MCYTLMRGRHDESIIGMFGADTRAMGRLTTCSDPILIPINIGTTAAEYKTMSAKSSTGLC